MVITFIFQLTLVCLPKTPRRCRGETLSLEHLIGEGLYELCFCLSSPGLHDCPGRSLLPGVFPIIFFQDGSRGGDVRDIQGPSVWFQGWYLVPRDHLNWARSSRAPEPRDEPNESFAENREIGSSIFDAAVALVSGDARPEPNASNIPIHTFFTFSSWRSPDFRDFLKRCLDKHVDNRWNASQLLQVSSS